MDYTTPKFRTDKYTWLDKRTRIDLDNLDDAVSEMPELIRQCGECVALANEIRDAVRVEVDRVRAQIAEELRSVTVNGKAPSESQIESKLPLDNRFAKIQNDHAEARQDASLWASLMEALRNKASGMRVAADLIGTGYITRDYISSKYRQQIRDVKK